MLPARALPSDVMDMIGTSSGPAWMRAVAAMVACLPYRWLRPLGAALGAFVFTVVRVRRAHVIACVTRAGIDAPPRVAAAMYASLGAGLLELLWLAGRPPDALDAVAVFTPEADEAIARAAAGGRGVLIATAHTGNWDLAACATARWLGRAAPAVGALGPGRGPLHVVTKRLSWRALDRYWQHLRAARGVKLIDARGAVRRVQAALAAGEAVAMMVDQVPERRTGSCVAPFLGAPARHDLAPATLAARAGAPIVVAFGHRASDGRHVMDVYDVLPPQAGPRAIADATARIALALERFVEQHPAQWLWLHRRWKGCETTPEDA